MSQQPVSLSYASPGTSNQRQGFGIRLGAAFVDALICAVPAGILTVVGGLQFGPLLGTAAILGYSSLEIFKAATPGKMIFKLRITNEDGTEASRDALFKRWLIKQVPNCLRFVTALFLALSLAGVAALVNWVAVFAGIAFIISCCLTFRPERQALHDTMSHTAIFRTQAAVAAMPAPAQEPQRQAA
jgi:uncharacterized RDD family membrane protein YckC